jgi:hypothetical protein
MKYIIILLRQFADYLEAKVEEKQEKLKNTTYTVIIDGVKVEATTRDKLYKNLLANEKRRNPKLWK